MIIDYEVWSIVGHPNPVLVTDPKADPADPAGGYINILFISYLSRLPVWDVIPEAFEPAVTHPRVVV